MGFDEQTANEYLQVWLARINTKQNSDGAYRTYRQNSSMKVYDWMDKVSYHDRSIIENAAECMNVISELTYPNLLTK